MTPCCDPNPSPRHRSIHLALLAAALAMLSYASVFDAPFVWDDRVFIVKNPAVTHGVSLSRYFTDREIMSTEPEYNRNAYRPLRTLIYRILYSAFGADPFPFHVFQALLHALVSALALFLLLRLGIPRPAAFAAACLFAVHPIHTEAVSWISSTSEPMFSLFVLLALLALAPDRPPTAARLVAALVAALAALLTKEMAITLPVLAAATWVWAAPDTAALRRASVALLSLLLLAAAYVAFRLAVVGSLSQEGVIPGAMERLAGTGALALRYLALSLAPLEQNAFAGRIPKPAWGIALVALGVLWSGWRAVQIARRRLPRSTLELLLMLFLIALLPVLGLVPLWVDYAERFAYLPSLFAEAAAVLVIHRLIPRRHPRLFPGMIGVLVIIAGVATHYRNRLWRDELLLWQETARVASDNPTVFWNLGLTLEARGRYIEAAESLERAAGAPKPSGQRERQIAQCYLRAGRAEQAQSWLERGLAMSTSARERATLLDIRGLAQIALERPGADESFASSIALSPGDFRPYLHRAQWRLEQRDAAGALADIERAGQLGAGSSPEVRFVRARTLLLLHRRAEANALLDVLIAEFPGDGSVRILRQGATPSEDPPPLR